MSIRTNVTTTLGVDNSIASAIKRNQQQEDERSARAARGDRDKTRLSPKDQPKNAVSIAAGSDSKKSPASGNNTVSAVDTYVRKQSEIPAGSPMTASSNRPTSEVHIDVSEESKGGLKASMPAEKIDKSSGKEKAPAIKSTYSRPVSSPYAISTNKTGTPMRAASTIDQTPAHASGTDGPHESRDPGDRSQIRSSNSWDDKNMFASVPARIRMARETSATPPDRPNAEVSKDAPKAKQDNPGSAMLTGTAGQSSAAAPADPTAMQKQLSSALNFRRAPDPMLSGGSPSTEDNVKYLQNEGVFGFSASGRNLSAMDFIRQRQFEYQLDQKQLTTDDLLLETEKAIYDTLNTGQSSSVTKSLLQAAESINSYRNLSTRDAEDREETGDASKVRPTDNAADA